MNSFHPIEQCHTSSTQAPRLPHQFPQIVFGCCASELILHDVSFAYLSHPNVPVLSNVSLFLPAREATFIVGASGPGKSTIAALLLRLYSLTSGSIHLDDQGITFLDDCWAAMHVAGVTQSCLLQCKEVIEACHFTLMHEFFRKTGKWRHESFVQLAIARARLCDPTVLILATLSLGMPKIFD
jgi:ATP-binding cassette subfamily B (MDR/TAP) protein 1